MSEPYLWDRSGTPDPEIDDLERTLAPLRYRRRGELAGASRSRRPVWWVAAAAVLLAAIASWQLRMPAAPVTGWQVAEVEGQARLGGREAAVAMPLRAGQTLETGNGSGLTLQADEMGRIDLGPDSTLRAGSVRQVRLGRGRLHAFIWAPPRQFVVETPSARAVDLGCEYTLTVDGSGDGLIRVATGWVAFETAGHEAFIPAGAACVTSKRQGPGIPFYEDADDALKRALRRYENGDSAALTEVLDAARPRDSLTLWHLMTRNGAEQRGLVFDRFAELVALPPQVERENVLRGEPRTLDQCWDALNLENTGWWRGLERKW